MATIKVSGKFPIDAGNTYILGSPDALTGGALTLQLVNDNTLSASIVVSGRSLQGDALTDDVAFVPIVYKKLYLNGSVGDGSLASTAITTNSLIEIPASGMQIALVVTYTSGSASGYVMPTTGGAAV
jgi:hypothetical protein